MAIPEHDKCVRMRKRIRYKHHYGVWRAIRYRRRKSGKIKPRERVRTKVRVEAMLSKAKLLKITGASSYTELYKVILGPHYRRWGKYDD